MAVLDIAPADIDGLGLMLDWAAAEGWNPGREDAAPFLAADPGGFLIASEDGEPRSCISVVRHGEGFGFLGFFITHPDHRGRGIGGRLWRAGMARLAGRNIGLDGVVAQQERYRRDGFVLAHRNLRHGGVITATAPAAHRVLPLAAVPAMALARYDRDCFPAERGGFLRSWTTPPRHGLAWVEDGQLRGYGVVRACREGHKIGPLFADRPEIAEALLLALAASTQGARVYLDVPEPNGEALRLAARHGLTPIFETARMYTAGDPGLPLERIHGITTLELG